jgi:hypothetical protein
MRTTAAVAWVLSTAVAISLGRAQPAERLVNGANREAEIRAQQVHRYDVELSAGSYFSVSIDQRGADVSPKMRHLKPAAALGSAQREMHAYSRWADPYYWAGFVVQGEWR